MNWGIVRPIMLRTNHVRRGRSILGAMHVAPTTILHPVSRRGDIHGAQWLETKSDAIAMDANNAQIYSRVRVPGLTNWGRRLPLAEDSIRSLSRFTRVFSCLALMIQCRAVR